ncbi:MAG TPA: YCF48-related protein [Candidatus Kapabacteria bacterium]|nr:YCF48-related protein [Candidatus Kapabacteria bacterium]
MKTKILIILFFSCLYLNADIPNPSFENWEINEDGGLKPVGWITPNSAEISTVLQSEDSYSGTYAAELTVVWDAIMESNMSGYLFADGNFPVNQRYTTLTGYMKGHLEGTDSLKIAVGMFKESEPLGGGTLTVSQNNEEWTKFTVNIIYYLEGVPDEGFISFYVGNVMGGFIGTSYLIDNLEFDGGSSPTNPVVTNAYTNTEGTKISLKFNQNMADPSGNQSQFALFINGTQNNSITNVELNQNNSSVIDLTVATPITEGQILSLNYIPGTIRSYENVELAAFSNLSIVNMVSTGTGEWKTIQSPTTNNLKSVFFIDQNTGWISGENATMFKTTDGGSTWNQLNVPTEITIFSVAATSANNVFASCWDTIYCSNNGGQTWDARYTNTVNNNFLDIFIYDQNNIWVAGEATTFTTTTNGGNSWDIRFTGISICNFNSVSFPNLQKGWAAGDCGVVAKTTDGGNFWLDVGYMFESDANYYSVAFSDQNKGWIVGDSGIVLITSDLGENWTKTYINQNLWLKDVDFVDNNTGWVIGDNGIIYKTINAGVEWIEEQSPTTQNLKSVYMVSNKLGWAVGENGTILKYSSSGSYVDDNLKNDNIYIYPNPSDGKFTLEFNNLMNENANLSIFSIDGKLLYKNQINPIVNNKIDLKINQKGLILINVKTNSYNITKHLIIK